MSRDLQLRFNEANLFWGLSGSNTPPVQMLFREKKSLKLWNTAFNAICTIKFTIHTTAGPDS